MTFVELGLDDEIRFDRFQHPGRNLTHFYLQLLRDNGGHRLAVLGLNDGIRPRPPFCEGDFTIRQRLNNHLVFTGSEPLDVICRNKAAQEVNGHRVLVLHCCWC